MVTRLRGETVSYNVGILIASDRCAFGQRDDLCLPVFRSILADTVFDIKETAVTSDDPEEIKSALKEFIGKKLNLILTSGGTGCGNRDNTPEVTKSLLDKPTSGLDEAIRQFSRDKSKFAMYSRGISGVAKNSFIINLPGSPKAVSEILVFLLPTIEHPLKLIASQIVDCVTETSSHD